MHARKYYPLKLNTTLRCPTSGTYSWGNDTLYRTNHTILIIAKYYIYTASKNEEDYYFFDAFLSILKNKIQIETSKAKVQVKL